MLAFWGNCNFVSACVIVLLLVLILHAAKSLITVIFAMVKRLCMDQSLIIAIIDTR